MLNAKTILVVEDDTYLMKTIGAFLESQGADVSLAKNLEQARNLLDGQSFDFALMDVHLPDGNSLEILKAGLVSPNTGVVIMTAEGGVETAVEAMKLGAGDYLSKPFDPAELPIVLKRLGIQRQKSRIDEFENQQKQPAQNALFFGNRLNNIEQQLEKIQQAESRMRGRLPPLLIQGETGTGKSTLARWIHRQGVRKGKPLIELNCSTLPDNLAESELFGHEKGAFTDAKSARIGLFEAADGGSLFLDEIANLSAAIQTKVLTAIEDGVIRRVGSTRSIEVDVRLIAASIRPLEDLVKAGEFREDLFHRLNLLRLNIPPLRDFPEDIPKLANHLLKDLKSRHRLPDVSISDSGKSQLMNYSWPGNVRELSHELERALIFQGKDQLDFETLNADRSTSAVNKPINAHQLLNPLFQLPESDFNLETEIKALERSIIDNAMQITQGNISAAARRLGVPRDFVRYRIES